MSAPSRGPRGANIVSITIDHGATAEHFEKRAADRMEEATSGRAPNAPGLREDANTYAAMALSHRVAQLVDVLSPDVEVVEKSQ